MVLTVTGCALLLAGAMAVFAADVPQGSSEKGARLFEAQQCVACHSVDGRGGKTAPDLGQRIGRNHTAALLTSTLWNHAPVMWADMFPKGVDVPAITTQDAADLFAFFYSARFFDKPGDAGRGKDAFSRHHCADCHAITEQNSGPAPAVASWKSLGSPVALAESMWNHAEGMREEFSRRGYRWPNLTSQQLTDIFVYLSNHPSIPKKQASFEFGSGSGGEALFKEKGCAECHRGDLDLLPRLRNKTINDIAAAMWNHAPKMTAKAGTFETGEMNTLLSYLWAHQFFDSEGDAASGRRVFVDKSCAGCHEGGRAPQLSGGFTLLRMAAALWNHGPGMLQQVTQQAIAWPRFREKEMADLVAYLNSIR